MDSVSAETAIIFFAVLFIAFCCGFVRSIRQHFVVKRRAIANLHRMQRRNVIITHINIPENSRPSTYSLDDDVHVTLPGVFLTEEQLRPPPYTAAVSNTLPPSYDEAIKLQNTENNTSSNISTTETIKDN